jgi:hypothetical protein
MLLFARAVVTGFGLSLGAALFKKVQSRLGLDEEKDKEKKAKEKKDEEDMLGREGVTDPNLQA